MRVKKILHPQVLCISALLVFFFPTLFAVPAPGATPLPTYPLPHTPPPTHSPSTRLASETCYCRGSLWEFNVDSTAVHSAPVLPRPPPPIVPLLLGPIIPGLCYSASAPIPLCCMPCLLPHSAGVSRAGRRTLGTISCTPWFWKDLVYPRDGRWRVASTISTGLLHRKSFVY